MAGKSLFGPIGKESTFTVAGSNALHKHTADYVCTGVDDQLLIEQAFADLPAEGGKIAFMGTFYLTADLLIENQDNWTMSGHGKSTKFVIADKFESALTVNGVAGAYTAVVADTTGYRIGQWGIIVDDNSDIGASNSDGGWDYFTITDITGNVVTMNLTLNQDYTTALNSKIYTACNVMKVDNCDNIVIEDIQIDGNKANQATGAKSRYDLNGLYLNGVTNSTVERIYSHDCANLAVRVDTCEHTHITRNRLDDSFRGMCMYGSSLEIMASFNVAKGHSSNGFRFCSACDSGYYFNEAYDNIGPGFRVNNPEGAGNTTIFGNRSHGNTYGIKVDAPLAGSDRIFVSNNVVYENTHTGIYLTNIINSVISNNQVYNNATQGMIMFTGCNDNEIANNHFKDNGLRAIRIAGGDNNSIHGNKMSGATYGIVIDAGADNNIHNNRIAGTAAVSPAIQNNGGTKEIWNNIGFVTENTGTATLLSAQTAIAVTHGLDLTPAAGDITVTPAASLGSANSFWIDTYTATQFTIHTNVAPGADVAFVWIANVR